MVHKANFKKEEHSEEVRDTVEEVANRPDRFEAGEIGLNSLETKFHEEQSTEERKLREMERRYG